MKTVFANIINIILKCVYNLRNAPKKRQLETSSKEMGTSVLSTKFSVAYHNIIIILSFNVIV